MRCLVLGLLLGLAACGGAAGGGAAPSASYDYRSQQIYGGMPQPMAALAGAEVRSAERDEADDGISDATARVAAKSEDATPKPAGPPPPPPPGTVPSQAKSQQAQQSQDNRAQPETAHETTMLIYTANLTMAVYQVEPGLAAIEKIGRDVGGYLAVRNDRVITIRVPRARFDEALREVEKTGDVIHREVLAEDVTDQFVDLDARLKNAQAMRDRLQELIKKANTKEALEIEVQLERVMGEIESMQGKLKLLKDKIAFSMISVTFEPRGAAAVRDMPIRLPFPWLGSLGLPRLLSLSE